MSVPSHAPYIPLSLSLPFLWFKKILRFYYLYSPSILGFYSQFCIFMHVFLGFKVLTREFLCLSCIFIRFVVFLLNCLRVKHPLPSLYVIPYSRGECVSFMRVPLFRAVASQHLASINASIYRVCGGGGRYGGGSLHYIMGQTRNDVTRFTVYHIPLYVVNTRLTPKPRNARYATNVGISTIIALVNYTDNLH